MRQFIKKIAMYLLQLLGLVLLMPIMTIAMLASAPKHHWDGEKR